VTHRARWEASSGKIDKKKEGLEWMIRAAALVKNWKCMCGCGYGGLFHSLTDLSCNVFHSELNSHFKTGNCKLPALGVLFFLWCNNIGDHPQEKELAKFGYRSERKVEINFFLRILLFFDETCLSKYGKFQKLFPLMNFVWVALEFFFMRRNGENLSKQKRCLLGS
jgi:hypothetical protein